MELKKRTVELANFNCVFGDENEPLLAHFSDVFYPAITSGYDIKYNGNHYTFDNINIFNHPTLGYVLTGLFIKQTELEILSQKDPISGKLISTNKSIPSAPFSIFVLLLKNHRLLFFKNQNGSPRTTTLKTICEKIISRYLRKVNLGVNYNSKLPAAHITIIPLPSNSSLKEQFKNLKQINSIVYKITPLNGDENFKSEMTDLLNQVNKLKARDGSWKINKPEDKDKVIEQIEDTRDLALATVRGTAHNGNPIILTPDNYSEKVLVKLPVESNQESIIESMYNIATENSALLETSETNKNIYSKSQDMIQSLMR